MNLLLILLLIGILFIAYYGFNREICSPGVLFVSPFIVMCIVAQFFQKTWSYELQFNTFFIVFSGNLFFVLGAYIGNGIKLNGCGIIKEIKDEPKVQGWKYIFLLCIQCLCYLTKIKYIMEFAAKGGITNNLSKALVYYNNTIKFTTNETINFPTWLTLGLDICTMFGFFCACILAQQFILKRERQNSFLILLNFIVAVIGGSTSGGRGGSVQMLLAFLCAYLILYQRKDNWLKPVPLKGILFVGMGIIGVIVLFVASVTWIGRYDVHMYGRYIANYIGAQIFNFNYMLNNGMNFSEILGQETFYPIIEKFASWFNISQWENFHVGARSIYAAGYNTGNVFTCFYSYYKDFGMLGVFILPFIFGVFFQIIYRYARYSNNSYSINLSLVLYSNFAYMIIFSFFADKFGNIVFTFNMLKRVIILLLVEIFLYRIDICGLKITISSRYSE